MIINAKFAGCCKVCRAVIKVGQRIQWDRANGARCVGHIEPVACLAPALDDLPPPEADDFPPEESSDLPLETLPF